LLLGENGKPFSRAVAVKHRSQWARLTLLLAMFIVMADPSAKWE